SFTALAVGLTELGCCAATGNAQATTKASASAPTIPRTCAISFAISLPPRSSPPGIAARVLLPAPRFSSGRNRLVIGGLPAPGAGAITALGHPLLVNLRDDLAIAGQQRFGRAHL